VDGYRSAVMGYRNAQNKEQKRAMEKLISQIKNDFESDVAANDKRLIKINKLRGEIFQRDNQIHLFEMSKTEKTRWENETKKILAEIDKLEKELEEIKNNKIYENAFEWRFEFPEVLNNDGDFVGFDVVIGNPPYIRQEEFSEFKAYYGINYKVYHGVADLYTYFIERGINILKQYGIFSIIVANKWMRANYGNPLRGYLKIVGLREILDFGDLPVFQEATTYPCILAVEKGTEIEYISVAKIDTLQIPDLTEYLTQRRFSIPALSLNKEGWTLTNEKNITLLNKIKSVGIPLCEYVNEKLYRGVLTGLNKAFVIDLETRNKLIAEDPKAFEIIKPFLAGKDIKRYIEPETDKFLIFTRRGISISKYFSIEKYLTQFKNELEPGIGRKPGNYKWYEIQDTIDYYLEFEKPKIIYPNICKKPEFTYDCNFLYTNQKCFIIPCDDKFLLAILNSSISYFFFMQVLPKLKGDFYEPGYVYLKDLPIAKPDKLNHKKIVEHVDQILSLKKADPNADTSALEKAIDKLVYELYGLTDEEIRIVEGEK